MSEKMEDCESLSQNIESLMQLAVEGDLDSIMQHDHLSLRNCRDKNGSTLLHYAAGNGRAEICRFLLEEEISTVEEKSSGNERTALHWAARNGHTSTCVELVQIFGAKVDALGKGEVTPLQLATWQCHVETCKVLVEKLGANPHFPNAWGCGIAHWIGKSPIYDGTSDSEERLKSACDWLFLEHQVDYNLPNNHGQTPLHKAAYAGNVVVAKYLIQRCNIVDSIVDNQGNSAADCCERSEQHELARWLRRHASTPVNAAVQSLGLQMQEEMNPPNMEQVRTAFLKLAKLHHPDKTEIGDSKRIKQNHWNTIRDAYQLLKSWWIDDPDLFDCQIRLQCRNSKLMKQHLICWTSSWHEKQSDQQSGINIIKKNCSLDEFEFRLVRLLSTNAFRNSGIPISQLPKEYEKNWHEKVPKPREFGCRKLICLLRTHCKHVKVEINKSQQAMVQIAA